MGADRLVRIILLLQSHKRLTARDLAERLEVSPRTILRDIDRLSGSGVPVYAERGALGGFSLFNGYRLDLSGLRTPELSTLLLGERENLLRDLGWVQEAAAAQDKLRHALPPEQLSQVDLLSERILIDDSQWFEPIRHAPLIAQLLSAVWQNHRVTIVYSRSDGTSGERSLAPYALAAKAGVWYVVAKRDNLMRVYRIDRIKDVTVSHDHFERTPEFDLGRFWSDWVHSFEVSRPRFAAQLLIASEIYPDFLHATPWAIEEPTIEDSGYRLIIWFEQLESAARHIMSFMPDVRVIEPSELKQAVRQLAHRIGVWDRNTDH